MRTDVTKCFHDHLLIKVTIPNYKIYYQKEFDKSIKPLPYFKTFGLDLHPNE